MYAPFKKRCLKMSKNSLHSPFHGDQEGHMFKIWSHSVWFPKMLLGKKATLESCWAHGRLCISKKDLSVESLSFQNTSTSVLYLSLSRVQFFVTPGSFIHRGFPGKVYWSGLPCPPPGDLPNPGVKPRSPTLQADSLLSEHSTSYEGK